MMTTTVSDWQVLPVLMLIGAFLGMQGSLCLVYDLSGRRQQVLNRCIWVFSSGFLIAAVLIASYLFFLGRESLASGYSPPEVWRVGLIVSPLGFLIQFAFFSPPFSVNSAFVFWLKWVYLLALSSTVMIGMGSVLAPQGSGPLAVVIFALPALLVIGILNGFSPAIHRWIFHLPEKRIAIIGIMLSFCSFALIVVPSVFSLLGLALP